MATTTIPLQPVGSLITLGMPINVTRAKQALKVFVTQETQTVFNLIKSMLESPLDRIAVIHSDPGMGKTCIALALTQLIPNAGLTKEVAKAVYFSVYNKISVLGLLKGVAEELGLDPKGSRTDLYSKLKEAVTPNTFLFIDECDGLTTAHFEILRYLSDECGATVVLFGTTGLLLGQVLNDKSGRVVAQRLLSRIGQKQYPLKPIDDAVFIKYILEPHNIATLSKSNMATVLALTKYDKSKNAGANWRIAEGLAKHAIRVATARHRELDSQIPLNKDGKMVITVEDFTEASRQGNLAN